MVTVLQKDTGLPVPKCVFPLSWFDYSNPEVDFTDETLSEFDLVGYQRLIHSLVFDKNLIFGGRRRIPNLQY